MRLVVLLAALCIASCESVSTGASERHEQPNILLILVDDLGWSDIGAYGGEIPTPNLDQLAADGLRFTSFHTAMKCNPSRAMLLTGLDNNVAASGPRTNYQLRPDVPTLAEQLRGVGYRTYIAGKWDVGSDAGERPFDRGFQQSAVLLPGAGLHFRSHDGNDIRDDGTTRGYSVNGRDVAMPESFYSTHFYTERMRSFIDAGRDSGKPFFGYLAYTAPHYPLQAPADSIASFAGWYREGYRAILEQRIKRLHALGLFDGEQWPIPDLPEWDALTPEERAYEAKRMQVYAAMVAELDNSIGELLRYLDRAGLAESTVVVFASDNGADGTARGAGFRQDAHDNTTDNLGSASSFVTQGMNWAQVSSTPWRLVKGYPTEGGTRAPLLVRWPGMIRPNTVSDEWLRISDLAPTLLTIAGAAEAVPTHPLAGRSALPLFLHGEPVWHDEPRIHTYVERRLGGASVVQGQYKLVWWKTQGKYGAPMLFDLSTDPAEIDDIAGRQPERRERLVEQWHRYREMAGDGIAEAEPVGN